jgi:hypothetical protein
MQTMILIEALSFRLGKRKEGREMKLRAWSLLYSLPVVALKGCREPQGAVESILDQVLLYPLTKR